VAQAHEGAGQPPPRVQDEHARPAARRRERQIAAPARPLARQVHQHPHASLLPVHAIASVPIMRTFTAQLFGYTRTRRIIRPGFAPASGAGDEYSAGLLPPPCTGCASKFCVAVAGKRAKRPSPPLSEGIRTSPRKTL